MTQQRQISVEIKKQRKYNVDMEMLTFRRNSMSKQAKTLNAQEIRRVLDYIATRKHSERNRTMLLTIKSLSPQPVP